MRRMISRPAVTAPMTIRPEMTVRLILEVRQMRSRLHGRGIQALQPGSAELPAPAAAAAPHLPQLPHEPDEDAAQSDMAALQSNRADCAPLAAPMQELPHQQALPPQPYQQEAPPVDTSLRAALAIAAAARAARCDVLRGPPRSSREDPNFQARCSPGGNVLHAPLCPLAHAWLLQSSAPLSRPIHAGNPQGIQLPDDSVCFA